MNKMFVTTIEIPHAEETSAITLKGIYPYKSLTKDL